MRTLVPFSCHAPSYSPTSALHPPLLSHPSSLRNFYLLMHLSILFYAFPRSQSAFITILSHLFTYPILPFHLRTSFCFPFLHFQHDLTHVGLFSSLSHFQIYLLSANPSYSISLVILVRNPPSLDGVRDAPPLRPLRAPVKSIRVTHHSSPDWLIMNKPVEMEVEEI